MLEAKIQFNKSTGCNTYESLLRQYNNAKEETKQSNWSKLCKDVESTKVGLETVFWKAASVP